MVSYERKMLHFLATCSLKKMCISEKIAVTKWQDAAIITMVAPCMSEHFHWISRHTMIGSKDVVNSVPWCCHLAFILNVLFWLLFLWLMVFQALPQTAFKSIKQRFESGIILCHWRYWRTAKKLPSLVSKWISRAWKNFWLSDYTIAWTCNKGVSSSWTLDILHFL